MLSLACRLMLCEADYYCKISGSMLSDSVKSAVSIWHTKTLLLLDEMF